MNEKLPEDQNEYLEIGQDPEYREILDRIKILKEKGLNPFDDSDFDPDTYQYSDPERQELGSKLDVWKSQFYFTQDKQPTPKDACGAIKGITVWLDAGYEGREALEEALDELRAEEAAFRALGVDSEIINLVSKEIEKRAAQYEVLRPGQEFPAEIEGILTKARGHEAAGEYIHAIPYVGGILFGTKFKKYLEDNLDKKSELQKLHADYMQKWSDQKKAKK